MAVAPPHRVTVAAWNTHSRGLRPHVTSEERELVCAWRSRWATQTSTVVGGHCWTPGLFAEAADPGFYSSAPEDCYYTSEAEKRSHDGLRARLPSSLGLKRERSAPRCNG